MNASALLTSQGWLGPGHALDSRLTDYGAQTYKQKGHRGLAYDPSQSQNHNASSLSTITTGNGLIRPLLVSQRHGSKNGIGKKSHEPASGNEWWLKGFASALANVGKSESERSTPAGSGTSTPRSNTYGYVGKHSGLYSYFTSGQVMEGTIKEQNLEAAVERTGTQQQPSASERKKSKKRKSDVLEEEEKKNADDTKSPTVATTRSRSPVKRPQTAQELESSIPYLTERDKERKKSHRRNKTTDVEQFAVIGEFLGASLPASTIAVRRRIGAANTDDDHEEEENKRPETKEERRARRKRRKEEERAAAATRNREFEKSSTLRKTKKPGGKSSTSLTLAQMVQEELAKLSSLDNTSTDQEQDRSDSEPESEAAAAAAARARRKEKKNKDLKGMERTRQK